jgi:hypothetical protein
LVEALILNLEKLGSRPGTESEKKSKKEDDFDSGDDGKCKGGSKNSVVNLEQSDQQPSKHDAEKGRI